MKYFAAMIVLSILMLVGCKNEIAESANSQTNQEKQLQDGHLVIYYPFNGSIKEMSGSGTKTSEIIYGVQLSKDRFEKAESAYYFDGTSLISCGDVADINSGSITVSAWIKCDDYDRSEKIISKGQSLFTSPANSGYSIRIVSNGMYPTESTETELWFQIIDDNGTREYAAIPVSKLEKNNYIMVSGVYDNTVSPALLKLFVNGYLVSKKEVKLGKSNTNGYLSFGALDRGGSGYPSQYDEYFKGNIDDVIVYNRALTEVELKSLHERKE